MRDKILEIKPTKNVNNEWSKSNGCVYVIYKKINHYSIIWT